MFLRQTTLDLTSREKRERINIHIDYKECSSVPFIQIFARISCVSHSLCTNIINHKTKQKKHSNTHFFPVRCMTTFNSVYSYYYYILLYCCRRCCVNEMRIKCRKQCSYQVRFKFCSVLNKELFTIRIYFGCCYCDFIIFLQSLTFFLKLSCLCNKNLRRRLFRLFAKNAFYVSYSLNDRLKTRHWYIYTDTSCRIQFTWLLSTTR